MCEKIFIHSVGGSANSVSGTALSINYVCVTRILDSKNAVCIITMVYTERATENQSYCWYLHK